MKKQFIISVLALLGITQLAAQETEYVPFVREGVKWVCYYHHYNQDNNFDKYYHPGRNYFTLEIKGDTVIDGKCYKAMHKYSGTAINTANDTIPLYLREENQIVYGISPEGHFYPGLLVGYGHNIVGYDPNIYSSVGHGEEIVLYDFNDPADYYGNYALRDFDFQDLGCDQINVGNSVAKRHRFSVGPDRSFFLIEGIGFDVEQNAGRGTIAGYTLGYIFSDIYDPTFRLSHVIEDGEIIYKSVNYVDPQRDDYEYVPFVREGVKWIYYYDNPFSPEVLDMDSYVQYYSFEMKGDYLIGDKHYKQVCLTHYLDENTKEVEEFIPVYLREEDKVVYAIYPDGIRHPQCPVGIGSYVGDNDNEFSAPTDEFVLYDFNDPISLYDSVFYERDHAHPNYPVKYVRYVDSDFINVGKNQCKRHHYEYHFDAFEYSYQSKIIEGIGYDGSAGFPLFYFEDFGYGYHYQVKYYLSHVIEDGEIIYKGAYYNPQIRVGINEVMVDKARQMDENYYNLMGQPVGKDVPTTPGIYIHQGKKICVSRMP